MTERTTPTREMAEQVAKWLGCSGAHQVGDKWAPCESAEDLKIILKEGRAGLEARKRHVVKKAANQPSRILLQPELEIERRKKRRRYYTSGWEYLRERGIRGIDTLPGGGLVSKN